MSDLPPETIHVKRKRGTEEAPVDFLRVDRSKRFRNFSSSPNGWVYQRKQLNVTPAKDASEPTIPVIQPTKDGNEKLANRPNKEAPKSPTLNAPKTPASETEPIPTSTTPGASQATTGDDGIRKFHLSKSVLAQSASRVGKRRTSPAVFVERGPKKQKSAELSPQVVKAILDESNGATSGQQSQRVGEESPATASSPSPAPSKTALKRPGANSRTKRKDAESKNAPPPPSVVSPLAEMDELSMAMDVWTLNEIKKNLGLMENKGKYSPATSRWRPHAPKQRHPQKGKPGLAPPPAMFENGMDVDNETTDEEDYIIETYERVPAERLRDQAVPAHHVGLLVFDNEPDMEEFFYGNEDETDDEFPEDEEDEDAENYYTHDYPDEDLDWDDEFDRGASRFTYLSDNEEFDERDNLGDEAWERGDAANPFTRPDI